MSQSFRSWIELSQANLEHNLEVLRSISERKVVAPCIKANAYGHGLVEIATVLQASGITWFCVQSVDEARILRQNGITASLLLISPFLPYEITEIVQLKLQTILWDNESFQKLENEAKKQEKLIHVHLAIDTGLSREGILAKEAFQFARKIDKSPFIHFQGLCTHFASSDEPNDTSFLAQKRLFYEVYSQCLKSGLDIQCIHVANSGAILGQWLDLDFTTFVRPGIATYGLYPSPEIKELCLKQNSILKPVLSWKTRLSSIKKVMKGSRVSYGGTLELIRDSILGLIPVGYYDGIDRKLSNRGHVLINGQKCPILGRVCMNVCVIDLTDLDQVSLDDEVVIIGTQGNETVSAEDIAEQIGTINYEVLTRIRESITKMWLEN